MDGRITRRAVLAAGLVAAADACERSSTGGPVAGTSSPPGTRHGSGPSPSSGTAGIPTGTAAPPAPGAGPLTALPRPGLATVRRRTGVPVLCYHQIREPTAADGAGARTYIVSPGDFRSQLAELARAGFTSIGPADYYRHLTVGAPLPPRPVLITFDDAAAGQWPLAVPALRRHRFVATFFVMTVVLDKPGWLSRTQVRRLPGLGHTVAAHTWDHHPVPGYRGADWATQVTRPIRDLSRLAGTPVRWFAYPYGEWSRAAFPHLRHAGVLAAWQLAGTPLDTTEPLLTLRRRIVPGGMDLAGFRDLLASAGT